MTEPAESSAALPGERRGVIVARAMLWTGAATVALAAHVGAVAWALRQPPIQPAAATPPPAIMIEMAAEPEAINTEANKISEQTEDAPEIESETVEPVEEPEEPVEEVAEPEPPPEPEPQPVEQPPVTEPEHIEVPIPVLRPSVVEKPAEKPKKPEVVKQPERRKPAPASRETTEAAAQVQQSNRNAARQTVSGMGFGSVSPARWEARLMAHLERRKRYPSSARARGEQGTAYVRFRIDERGNVLSASLLRSSGFPELDAEVMEMVRRASPVPVPPPGVNKTITAPVRFTVR